MQQVYTGSPEQPAQLWKEHEKVLLDRGIPIDFAVKAGIRSVDLASVKHAKQRFHVDPYPNLPLHPVTGILIGYHDCLDSKPRWRVRSDVREYVQEGEPGTHHGEETVEIPRYICQAGIPIVPYIPKDVFKISGDTSASICLVEAPLKALCLCAHGYPAIGLGGVLAGAHDPAVLDELRELAAGPELRRIRWGGRKAYIVFDAGIANSPDKAGNPMVALGAAYLWRVLEDLGADVHIVTIPYHHIQDPTHGFSLGQDQGPDDFIARHGVDEFKNLVEQAVPGNPSRRLEQAIGRCTDEASRIRVVGDVLKDLYVQAALHVSDEATLAGVASLTMKAAKIGKRAIKDAVTQFAARIRRRQHASGEEWRSKLLCTKEGVPRPVTPNVELVLRHDAGLAGVIGFDEFGQALGFKKAPPWTDIYATASRIQIGDPWTEPDYARLGQYLSVKYRLVDVPKPKVIAAVDVVAREHGYHPVRDYLSQLKWDGQDRVGTWLSKYLGVEDTPYSRLVGRWWLISAAARILSPASKADCVVILEGAQGLRKSSALEVLGGEWYSDADLGDLHSKEASLLLQSVWILELAEGEIFSRAGERRLKGFVSKRRDDVVMKYSNLRTRLNRQCVFAITTNDEADYLSDPTGNRRYWPVLCRRIDLDALRAERDQLWAEAVSLFKEGARWYPDTDEEKAVCGVEQDKRRVVDAWEDQIREGVAPLRTVTIAQVLSDVLDVPTHRHGRPLQLRVSACLRSIGWVQEVRTRHDRVWCRGPAAEPPCAAASSPEDGEGFTPWDGPGMTVLEATG